MYRGIVVGWVRWIETGRKECFRSVAISGANSEKENLRYSLENSLFKNGKSLLRHSVALKFIPFSLFPPPLKRERFSARKIVPWPPSPPPLHSLPLFCGKIATCPLFSLFHLLGWVVFFPFYPNFFRYLSVEADVDFVNLWPSSPPPSSVPFAVRRRNLPIFPRNKKLFLKKNTISI